MNCIIALLVSLGFVAMVGGIVWIFKSPFQYPYKVIEIDISGKRCPKNKDLIDTYLNKHRFASFSNHYKDVQKWKEECQNRIAVSKLKRLRKKQYLTCLDDAHMFQFELARVQTRYRQKNYIKVPYQVKITAARVSYDYFCLKRRYEALESIDFECTVSAYNTKEQRRLMTKELRNEIALRDNYTCQYCGKYMPDGVGLQIDHIRPIAKGGKSVSLNLQVLCSKCNGKKSKNKHC